MHDWIDEEENDSEERKRTKEEKVFLMTSVRDLMTQEGAGSSVCETERRSLFHSIHVRSNIGTSVEHLFQDAERRQ